MENVGTAAQEEQGRELALIDPDVVMPNTEGEEEAESTQEFETVEAQEREASHDVCLDLCDDIREVLLQIQREITGLFNVPRLRAVEHRHKLNGIYTNMEKLYAQIEAGK